MATKKSELYFFTEMKKLIGYVITITEKSPKKFRFTLVARLQNYLLDAMENMYLANSYPLEDKRRFEAQNEAGRILRMFGYFTNIALECECILPKQAEIMSQMQAMVLLYLGKWIKSDQKRLKQNKIQQREPDAQQTENKEMSLFPNGDLF